jgi:hypothetical protein
MYFHSLLRNADVARLKLGALLENGMQEDERPASVGPWDSSSLMIATALARCPVGRAFKKSSTGAVCVLSSKKSTGQAIS